MTAAAPDFACFTKAHDDQLVLYLQVEGMRCASCAWQIEQRLQAYPDVEARVNFSTARLRITWPAQSPLAKTAAGLANRFAEDVQALGFDVAPFDPDNRRAVAKSEQRGLLACVAVAGFATGNIMLFSQALWFSPAGSLVGATRDLMHWVMALIALPATIYCGRPFFRSAFAALRAGRTNMDVPISLAVILANLLSVFETIRHGHFVYFDASVMLLFFLLIGRYLDVMARGKAREAAEGLLAMLEGSATVLQDGRPKSVRIRDLCPGQTLMVAAGEKIAGDGVVIEGQSEVDTRLVTGETLPTEIKVGDAVYAGMINQSAPLQVFISAATDNSLLSEIVALMERAEQSQSPYVRFADRIARLYAPVVHAMAATTFIGWIIFGFAQGHVVWEEALLKAMAVLIITCPCALGLAVPVVHVLASAELFRQGILLKSGRALEALARVDTVVFDKTGTLTLGEPVWINRDCLSDEDLALATHLASHSQHPLSRALAAASSADVFPTYLSIEDIPGKGLVGHLSDETVRIGKGTWLDLPDSGDAQMELWFQRGKNPAIRLEFSDVERPDALKALTAIRAAGFKDIMLSGDRALVARQLGQRLGFSDVRPSLSPVDKVDAVTAMRQDGHHVLMVGDGLNDAAALTAADVAMSPSSGMDITQNAADLVYRGAKLEPVLTALLLARRTQALVRQNFVISLIYNFLAIPAAVFGLVTPLIAALAMSGSSLIVVLNSMRLKSGRW